MKTLLSILILATVLTIGCKKKKTVSKPASGPATPAKVWCFYQYTQGNNFWIDCAKTQAEFDTKSQTYSPANGNYSYIIKTSCDSCN